MNAFSERYSINATWLIKLRWVAVFGQVLTVLGSMLLFNIEIPMLWAVIVVISATAISNLIFQFWFKHWSVDSAGRPWDLALGLILLMDMLSLTTLLFATGGPNNPFSLFFFVNLSLCALILNRNWAWCLNGLTILCFAGLIYEHHHIDQLDLGLDTIRDRGDISLYHMGLLIAFMTCSSVIVYFMTRLTAEVGEQYNQIQKAQAQQARSDKMEALGTLAAGTAHELATPLSTIAVVARDVEHAFEMHPLDFPGADDVLEDVHLIRSQLDRCRNILDRMASHAGETIGEQIQSVSLEKLAHSSLEGLIGRGRVQLDLPQAAATTLVNVPLDGLSQALRGLVQNALDADPSDRPVSVSLRHENDSWSFEIHDQGPGMTPEILERVSEPFFTTKPPGKGMGLGVFLAKNVVRRLQGSVEFKSDPGKGTRVIVNVPA
jgi:two-component system sensor histidine kinase RegB